MKNRPLTAFIILVWICITSCENTRSYPYERIVNKTDSVAVKQTIDKGEIIIIEQEYLRAGDNLIANGYYKEYYPNGKLKDSAIYRNNKKQGPWHKYAESGELLEKLHYFEGHKRGQQYYYENDRVREVDFFADNNLATFGIKYDPLGNITLVEGSCVLVDDGYDSVFSITDTVHFLNDVVELPGIITSLNIRMLDDDNKVYIDTIIESFIYWEPANIHFYLFGTNFSKGNNKYIAITKLIDSATSRLIKSDTVTIPIIVE